MSLLPTLNVLSILLEHTVGLQETQKLFEMIEIDSQLLSETSKKRVSRAILAQAMNMLLFAKNLSVVPEGRDYVNDQLKLGRKVLFDHGALRTVDAENTGHLPRGELAFKRLLEPLGYTVAGTYPLTRLKMTGRAYCHLDYPETIAQFFVSELHVHAFSETFQQAALNVVKSSKDPLTPRHQTLLKLLAQNQELSFEEATELLPALIGCFAVQHEIPFLSDYETLLKESAEMAWISTEGNSFNHATDRVPDVFQLAEEQRQLGRSVKDKVEVSADGRVRQTAFKAAQVQRLFKNAEGHQIQRVVPGSFYEFITRDFLPSENEMLKPKLALHFDTSNAQGIFKMTEAS